MKQNSTETANFSKIKSKERFTAIPCHDWDWVLKQSPTVFRLWGECWKSDPFGDRYRQLTTKLRADNFRKSKNILEDAGLFEFEPIQKLTKSGQRKITGWQVKNLHGAKSEFFKQANTEKTRKKKYAKFLQSDYWIDVKSKVLSRDNHTCQQCRCANNLQVHHLTYRNHGKEHLHLEDLITLCSKCHSDIHN